jgi:hypothetical protein
MRRRIRRREPMNIMKKFLIWMDLIMNKKKKKAIYDIIDSSKEDLKKKK